MPGRTPAEAVDAFLDPLRGALRVLDGIAKLLISPKGGFRKGMRYSWVLNGAAGMDLGTVGRFIDQWRMHWHPEGRSRITTPHLHRPPNLKLHWPTGRLTLENAVGWCVESGAAVTSDSAMQAQEQLTLIEAPHRLYRSWTEAARRPSLGCFAVPPVCISECCATSGRCLQARLTPAAQGNTVPRLAPVLRSAYEGCIDFGDFAGKFGHGTRFMAASDFGRWNQPWCEIG